MAGVLLFAGCSKPIPPLESSKEGAIASVFLEENWTPRLIGDPVDGPPWVTDLELVDLDADGLMDVVACEGRANQVFWIRQVESDRYVEQTIGDSVNAPVHIDLVDFDFDGDLDLLVASMGVVFPNDEPIGSIVLMEQQRPGVFRNKVLVDKIARVSDVRAADFDGDGDYDLAVGQFGYFRGEVRYVENKGAGRFESEVLLGLPGTIHTPVADFDGDGQLDFAALVSQDFEEIHLFKGDGTGTFEGSVIFGSGNDDFGSSGLFADDFDGDGDMDLLYSNGDAFDYAQPGPRPWHGVQWLENDGFGRFQYNRLGDLAGAYSPRPADLDGDGDMDVVAVSCFNRWSQTGAVSMAAFEQTREGVFVRRILARSPTHLVALRIGDMNGDGVLEMVTASFHAYPPYEHLNRVALWEQNER